MNDMHKLDALIFSIDPIGLTAYIVCSQFNIYEIHDQTANVKTHTEIPQNRLAIMSDTRQAIMSVCLRPYVFVCV